ncbi:MAG: class I SAM-dependent methyltransferase [Lentimicrobiaceae bacterium]|nr:class I SAM-dependent methyltransferase [Lentimicrobiaceae bacterium]
MLLLNPLHFTDYELIDSGNFEKLERFGKYILRRPEPQAVWLPSLPESEWKLKANASFIKEKNNPEKGEWHLQKGMPEQWFISYRYKNMQIQMRLGLTAFRHIGIFPEQSVNWDYIYDAIHSLSVAQPRVLNLFAYTGGASLVARAAGAAVTHVDSVKPVITWSRENMEASGLEGIRWVVEDALKFVRREVKRGNTYHGIILDPPAYGRGPDGEKWVLEDSIGEMMQLCSQLLETAHAFILLNLYSMGFSSLIAANLVNAYLPGLKYPEYGELFIPDNTEKKLPLGVFCRGKR